MNDILHPITPSAAEIQLVDQLADVERKISELMVEKTSLERLILKVRERNQQNGEVTRKNSVRRVLIESTILKALQGSKGYHSKELHEIAQKTVYDINYSTVRSHLHRMKGRGQLAYSDRTGLWSAIQQPETSRRRTLYLPQTIGARVRISADDPDAVRYLNWRGFVMESSGGGFHIMRRDLGDDAFRGVHKEPPLPRFMVELVAK